MSSVSVANQRRRTNVMIPDHVFGALVFVFVEIMFYSALLSSFVVMRRGRDSWGQGDALALPAWPEAFNGLMLALSAVSVLFALKALRKNAAQARGHLLRATGLAILFSAYQLVLGGRLISQGVTLNSSVFAACMYLMLGSHLLQALLGCVWMGKLVGDIGKGAAAVEGNLRGLAVLWCFLSAIWCVIYGALVF